MFHREVYEDYEVNAKQENKNSCLSVSICGELFSFRSWR